MLKGLRDIGFYCPSHSTRIMESRNAKFLENDLVSGSDRSLGVRSESDYSISQSSISSHGWTIIVHHAPQVQVRVEQPIPKPS